MSSTQAPQAAAAAPARGRAGTAEPAARRREWPRVAILAISLIGIAIAGYLTYIHYAGLKPLCVSGSGGCETVQSSPQSRLAGVPVALLGLIGYVVIFATALVRTEAARTAGALFALMGFGFSLYLTYEELFSIHAICQWCVASAVLMTVLAVLTCTRLLTEDAADAEPGGVGILGPARGRSSAG